VQRDLRSDLDAATEGELARRVEKAVVADPCLRPDPDRAAPHPRTRAGLKGHLVAELEGGLRGAPDLDDQPATELHVPTEAQREGPAAVAVGQHLDARQLMEVRAVRRVELEPPARPPQARIEALGPQLKARSLGAQAQVARRRSDGPRVHEAKLADFRPLRPYPWFVRIAAPMPA